MSPSDGVGPSGMNKVLLNRIESVFGAIVLVYKSNSFLAVKCVYMSVKCVCVCVEGTHACVCGCGRGVSSMLYLLFYTVYFDRTIFFSVILLLLLMSLGAV